MHGLGNDFVIIDTRGGSPVPDKERIKMLAHRRTGVGCDQVIVVDKAKDGLAAASLRIFNADGGAAEACGNAARCVAAWLMDEAHSDHIALETVAGIVDADRVGGESIRIDMGPPRFDRAAIPLADAAAPVEHKGLLRLDLGLAPLLGNASVPGVYVVSMGNPHAVIFVEDVAAVDMAVIGPRVEHHDVFPQRTNVEVVAVQGTDCLRLRVWERGVGLTPACGSGACAAWVAAHQCGLCARAGDVVVDGGRLGVEWAQDDHVLLTGAVSFSFTGRMDGGRT